MAEKILIVEDSKFFLKAITSVFEKEKFEVRTASTGEEAIRIAQQEDPPDVILLDMILPRLDGMMVLRMLRSFDKLRDIPVIVLSGNASEQDRSEAMKLGVVDYFLKDSTPVSELVSLVRRSLLRNAG
jgi:CheY-like chemotaxis protein